MKRMRLYLVAIAATIGGVVAAKLWQDRDSAPTPVATRKTSVEDVGRKIGGAAAGFGKGFVEGAKDRLKGQP